MPYIDLNLPRVYMCSPSRTPLPPPSPSHSSGSSLCTSPKHLYHASNLDWQFVSHMLFTCICYLHAYVILHVSPISSRPCPLSQSPKDCSIHLCLFCCLAYRVILTIFLNSVYICISIVYWCFSFWITSLCIIGCSFIHLIRTDSNVFFLMAE